MLPWAVLALCYLLTVGAMGLWGARSIDSDMASEMMLARLLNEEGGLLSENWYYSTELRVVSPVPVYQLALRIFPHDWTAARTLSIAVLLALVAASFIYMGRGAGLRDSAVYAAGLILLPVSGYHRYIFSHGAFYTVYVIFSCLMIGLTLRMDRAKRRPGRAALLIALGVVSGLSGVRMPMICGVPLLMACAAQQWLALRRAGTLREAALSREGMMFLGACLCMGGMLTGYLINSRVLERLYAFTSYDGQMLEQVNLSMLAGCVEHVLAFFGLNTGVPLLSAGALVDMLMLGVNVLMVLALCRLIVRREQLTAQERILVGFALLAVALGMFFVGATGREQVEYQVGYYMTGVLTLILLLMMALERMPCRMRGVRTAAMLAVCGVFVLESASFVRSHLIREQTEHEEAAAWLADHGYDTGFATFCYGNVLTEVSDGALEMYVYHTWDSPELFAWLQRRDHLTALPQGPVFAYVNGVEYYTMDIPCAQEDHLAYVSDKYGTRIYVYDSAQEVVELQRAAHAPDADGA